jgi:hypothetical protein
MTEDKTSPNNPMNASNRVTQIMPAVGWRVFEFSQDEAGKAVNQEIPVIGWGLRNDGTVSLLISHPNESNGRAAMSISEISSGLEDKYPNKVFHYQAVAPFQELADVAKEAEFVLGFLRANKAPAWGKLDVHSKDAAPAKAASLTT